MPFQRVPRASLLSHNIHIGNAESFFPSVCKMADKTVWIWLLLLATGIAGCEKSKPANRSPAAGKEQSEQDVKAASQKSSSPSPEEPIASAVSRTPDMPAYKWPADFKLPLIINMETPEVPEEIQNPSPPIEEEKKPIETEKQ
jgi:hypothetical protein